MIKQKIKNFIEEEDGIGTVEMILILVVLIGLVVIFKEQLNSLVESLFKTINAKAKSI
jgi:Flp pilus assembly pilin Flp